MGYMTRLTLTPLCAVLVGAIFLGTAPTVRGQADSAREALKARQEQIADAQEALNAAPNSRQKKNALEQAIKETFDFERLARESIGRHWDAITPAQQAEYTRLFKELVQKSTVRKLKSYRAAGTEYVDVQQDSTEAIITTVVTSTGGEEVAIQYKLHQVNGRWWVWDTTIGLDTEISEYDVSTAENYRSAFNRIISDDGIEELLTRLRTKIEGDEEM